MVEVSTTFVEGPGERVGARASRLGLGAPQLGQQVKGMELESVTAQGFTSGHFY